jgi:prepilin-type N-terminal cleavage/methylation domain-containing protein
LRAIGPALRDEAGFTLLEVMIAIVLMCVGLLAAAGSYPALTALSLYGKDQTRATNLAQQQLEDYRNIAVANLAPLVGDYRSKVAAQYFTQNGASLATSTGAYFTRDVQVQYWTWVTNSFAAPANPYATPTSGTTYMYRISTATHWLVHGQTIFTSGNSSSPNGCVTGGAAVPVGHGCVTVSSFAAP